MCDPSHTSYLQFSIPLLSDKAVAMATGKKRSIVFSSPGDTWLRMALGVAGQGDVRADVCSHVGGLPGELRSGYRKKRSRLYDMDGFGWIWILMPLLKS